VERYVPVVGIALLVGAGAGYALSGGGSPIRPARGPRVERFEQTTTGCRGTITPSGGTTVGPGGRFVSFSVKDADSLGANLATEITRTSPDGARVTTSRVDPFIARGREGRVSCAGAVGYRLNLTLDYRETMRVAVYEEGWRRVAGPTVRLSWPTGASGGGRTGRADEDYDGSVELR
jgi:hypothetical protein